MQNQTFVDGILNVRLMNPVEDRSTILVAIPGGPGITGHYLDEITVSLAKQVGINALIVDLPNHGQSGRLKTNSSIDYLEVRSIFDRFFAELSSANTKIIVLGHSLGAIIAADLLRSNHRGIEIAILVSGPIDMNGSIDFDVFLKSIGANQSEWNSEPDFQSWWKKVIPGYFLRPPASDEVNLLGEKTFWKTNEQFTQGIPSLLEISKDLKLSKSLPKVVYIEGEKELVLPKDNFNELKKVLPAVSFEIIKDTGHFPMLEAPDAFIKAVTKHLNDCTSSLLGKPQSPS